MIELSSYTKQTSPGLSPTHAQTQRETEIANAIACELRFPLLTLPKEIKKFIFSFLGPETLTSLRTLKCFHSLIPKPNPAGAWAHAVNQGYFDLVKWGNSHQLIKREELCALAAANGRLDILQWAKENGYPWDKRTCENAAAGGHLEVLQWARKHGCPWDEKTLIRAAANNQMIVYKWATNNECPVNESQVLQAAADNGHFDLVKTLLALGYPPSNRFCLEAAKKGQLEIVKLLYDLVKPEGWSELNFQAAINGHLDLFKWLFPQRSNLKADLLSQTALHGRLEVLQWLKDNSSLLPPGCSWDSTLICASAAAAKNGHLKILQWARANDCPWDEQTCSEAASAGHFEVLKWAVENGCPWDQSFICKNAATFGQLEMLQWARAKGCPWGQETCNAAVKGGHFEVLKWAIASGCPYSVHQCFDIVTGFPENSQRHEEIFQFLDTSARIAATGDLEALKAAIAQGYPWLDTEACYRAAKNGHLAILEWAFQNGHRVPSFQICRGAAEGGFVNILQAVQKTLGQDGEWLQNWDHLCLEIGRGGHLEVLKWAEQIQRINQETGSAAARAGHFEMVQYLVDKGVPLTTEGCYFAAQNGHLHILKWVVGKGCPWDKKKCACAAMENGHLEVVKWLREQHNYQWDTAGNDEEGESSDIALMAGRGHFEMLKWAREHGCPWDKYVTSYATTLEILKWAVENGCPWDEDTAKIAAEEKSFDMLKWAIAHGAPWKREDIVKYVKDTPHYNWLVACSDAALNGNLEALKEARKEGCPWDEETFAFAARSGRLEILQWLRSNGCPWSERTCAYAAQNGHLDILKWARENGCPWDALTCALAARNNQLEILKWARARGCPWDNRVVYQAAINDHLEILQWAVENGFPFHDDAAAQRAIVQTAIVFALCNGSKRISGWLYDRYTVLDPRRLAKLFFFYGKKKDL